MPRVGSARGGGGGGGLLLPETYSAPSTPRSSRGSTGSHGGTLPKTKPKSWYAPAAQRSVVRAAPKHRAGSGRRSDSPPPPPPASETLRPTSRRAKAKARPPLSAAAVNGPQQARAQPRPQAQAREARPQAGERWGYRQRPGHLDRFLEDDSAQQEVAAREAEAALAGEARTPQKGGHAAAAAGGLKANGPVAAVGASPAAARRLRLAGGEQQQGQQQGQQGPSEEEEEEEVVPAEDALAAVTAVATQRDQAMVEMDALARELNALRGRNAELERASAAAAEEHRAAMRNAVTSARHEAITESVNAAAEAAGEAAMEAYHAGEAAATAAAPQATPQAEEPSEEERRLRDKVQSALEELNRIEAQQRAEADGGKPQAAAAPGGASAAPAAGVVPQSEEAAPPPASGMASSSLSHLKDRQLQERLAMSQNIMRKLYRKNVELEKEVRVLRAAADSGPVPSQAEGERAAANGAPQLPEAMADSPAMAALRSRDATIAQLREALEGMQRRSATLEAAISETNGEVGETLRAALAEGKSHYRRFNKLRGEYRRLLNRRVEVVRRNGGMTKEARVLMDELRVRLGQEIVERDSEVAIFQAKLFESEQASANWYVERRLLEDRVEKLTSEVGERDRLDSQIETCVCGLFERMRALEATNKDLARRLESAGIAASPPPVSNAAGDTAEEGEGAGQTSA